MFRDEFDRPVSDLIFQKDCFAAKENKRNQEGDDESLK